MKKLCAVAAALALLCLGNLAQAITIDTVAVGDPGNVGELSGAGAGGQGHDRICGSVAYNYNIGKYEVTAGQYTAFLNAVGATDTYALYNTGMWNSSYGCKIQRSGASGSYTYSVASDYANRPVNYVSYWDSCRFANWLGNGQPTGGQNASTTERGAYTLDGYYNGTDGRNIQRNAGATWAVTSEDEWYKAAYYKGGGVYSLYANGTSTAPAAGTASNYNNAIGHTWDGTTNGALEQNGTKDMMGNVWEWNESVVAPYEQYAYRNQRGCSFKILNINVDQVIHLQSTYRSTSGSPLNQDYWSGFRVVSLASVPEPSSVLALLGGLAGLLGMRRRRV